MPTTAARFLALLEGAARSHGTYSSEEGQQGQKREIKKTARTIKEPVTEALWSLHLEGTRPLGVVTIREDDHCMWGAIDVDDYNVDPASLATRLERLGIPALVCRTKSGGAHVYLFFSEPIMAAEVMPRLRELSAVLGYGGSEVFPKQETVLADRGDLGSWLNMPYFNGDNGNRYAVRPDGRGLSTEGFLASAERARLTRSAFLALAFQQTHPEFSAGPPCLEVLTASGFPDGTRNNGLLALGVLAKKVRNGEGWEDLLEDWNQRFMKPPLPTAEVQAIIKSLRKKDYNYKCKDQPIVSCCNSALCRTRPHGVGAGAEATVMEAMSCLLTDPPIFFVVLKSGETIECSAAQFLSAPDFQLAVVVQAKRVIPDYTRRAWIGFVREMMEKSSFIEVPPDTGVKGRFYEILEQFLTDRHRGETRDDIALGKPWLDEAAGRVYFRLRDLEKALDRERFSTGERSGSIRSWATARIREMDGATKQETVAGRNINVWWLRADRFSWVQHIHQLPPHEESPL